MCDVEQWVSMEMVVANVGRMWQSRCRCSVLSVHGERRRNPMTVHEGYGSRKCTVSFGLQRCFADGRRPSIDMSPAMNIHRRMSLFTVTFGKWRPSLDIRKLSVGEPLMYGVRVWSPTVDAHVHKQ